MKKQQSSTKEALISRFIENHYNGDALKKFMYMSPRLSKTDLHFLQVSMSVGPAFNQRLSDHREAVDVILDMTSIKRSFLQIIPVLQGYAEEESCVSREAVSMITTNICAKALEDNVLTSKSQCGRKCPLMLGLNTQQEFADFTGVVKKLVIMNKFNIDSFRLKYYEMHAIPLQVLWHFHHTDLVMFTSYIYHNANRKEVIDHIKYSLVELLCSLSGVASCEAEDVSSGTNEQMMDVEEVVSASDNENNKLNFVILDGMRDSDEDSLLQLKQVIASDLVSLLLSVAKVPSPSTAGIKSCAKICDDILENVIDRAMDSILVASLNPALEVKLPTDHKNYLSLLLNVSTLTADLLGPFFTSHLVTTLTYKPYVDVYAAVSKQDTWTYKKSPAILSSIIGSMIIGLQAETFEVLKRILQKGQVNWQLVLVCVSAYLKCIPEGGRHMKELVDWLLNTAFLDHNMSLLAATFLVARQCCAEECVPWFSTYLFWFGATFGPESSWASRQEFGLLIQFLTDIVPYEPPACLRVHINKAPASTQSAFSLLGDYITLAKTRLKDLNEPPGFGLFGHGFTTEQDIDHALKHFETHNGEIAQILLSASVFRRQHFEQEFLPKLLTPRVIPDVPDIKAMFINQLYSMNKISHSLFARYREACLAEASTLQSKKCGEALLPQLTADDIMTLCKQYVPLQRSAPGVHIMEGVTSVDNRDSEAPGSTPLCLCLPPVRGSVGGDCYFPTAHEMHMEMSDKKKALKCRDCLVQ